MDVQNPEHKKVVSYLKHLGLSTEQVSVYLHLLMSGPQTVLQISRGLKSGRTKLYPLLEELAEKQLVTIHERHYGTTYEITGLDSLEFLVSEHERKAENLRKSLPAAQALLQQAALTSPSTSRIVEYRGVDGLKQMNFNLTKAKKEFRVYELAGLDTHLGKHFAEKMRERIAESGLTTYDMTNNSTRHHEAGIDSSSNHACYIDPAVFPIEFETYIYDNVVGLISYDKPDIFGVEIYNDKFARQQRTLFDAMWKLGKTLH